MPALPYLSFSFGTLWKLSSYFSSCYWCLRSDEGPEANEVDEVLNNEVVEVLFWVEAICWCYKCSRFVSQLAVWVVYMARTRK